MPSSFTFNNIWEWILNNLIYNFDLTNSAALAAMTVVFLLANRVRELRWGIPTLVTMLCGGMSLYIIFSKDFPVEEKQWAFGVVGAFTGFWLREND